MPSAVSSLTDDLLKYYQQVTRAVLGDDPQLMKVVRGPQLGHKVQLWNSHEILADAYSLHTDGLLCVGAVPGVCCSEPGPPPVPAPLLRQEEH